MSFSGRPPTVNGAVSRATARRAVALGRRERQLLIEAGSSAAGATREWPDPAAKARAGSNARPVVPAAQ